MAANYDSVLQQLRAAGLYGRGVDDGLQVGRMVRCKVEGDREKRGWYTLHEIQTPGGDLLLVGSYGVWQGNDNGRQKIEIDAGKFSDEQREAMRKRLAEDRRKADAARKADQEKAALAAGKAWAQGVEVEANQYLTRKGVLGYGLRQTPGGILMIPLLDTAGRIHGVQYVRTAAEAAAAKRPEKEFWPVGLAMKGHFFLIGMPSTVCLVAEGYATAATLHAATGLPVAVAFNAGNIAPVAAALRKRYKGCKLLICADDDAFAHCSLIGADGSKCQARFVLAEHPETCPRCGGAHKKANAGANAASAAALEVGGAWVKPVFADEAGRTERFMRQGHKHTDFNDLQLSDGLQAVRAQIEAKLRELSWNLAPKRSAGSQQPGGGGAELKPVESVEEMLERFSLVYAHGGTAFDAKEHALVNLTDVSDVCLNREIYKGWREHPERRVVRVHNVGFDPSGSDKDVTCNLWSGWPALPPAGSCIKLLELLRFLCSKERNPEQVYQWVLRWLAYPLQHPGAKMRTALVVHGPQGSGKSMFFEAVSQIYGKYGFVINQDAIEDKHNEWVSCKLFMIADEVLAKNEIYHIKNKLKGFITGDTIRINPKNIRSYYERNHVNVVFLSNESIPVALEEDDRRHAVIWTPEKLPADFYDECKAEIAAGGSSALYEYLLNVPLDGFNVATATPTTKAKDELIDLGLDNTTRFFYALMEGDLDTSGGEGEDGTIMMPGLAEDYYDLYRDWCRRINEKAARMPRMIDALKRKHGIVAKRARYHLGQTVHGPHSVLLVGKYDPPADRTESIYLGELIGKFKQKVQARLADRGNT